MFFFANIEKKYHKNPVLSGLNVKIIPFDLGKQQTVKLGEFGPSVV
jgi:hypothetical protein